MTRAHSPIAKRVTVLIEESNTGLFTATCTDIPGFFIAHSDRDAVERDIPNLIRLLLRRRLNQDIVVAKLDDLSTDQWVWMPAHIAQTVTAAVTR
jgi:hypothetical protein